MADAPDRVVVPVFTPTHNTTIKSNIYYNERASEERDFRLLVPGAFIELDVSIAFPLNSTTSRKIEVQSIERL